MQPKNMNNGFGPVYTRRSSNLARVSNLTSLSTIFIAIIIVFFFVNGQSFELSFINIIGQLSTIISASLLGEYLRRLSLFTEEFFHIQGRYNGSIVKGFLACIDGKQGKKLHMLGAFVISTTLSLCHYAPDSKTKVTSFTYVSIVITWMSMKLFGFSNFTKVEISELNEKQNTNVADGLAWSYYFGYLKFVLKEFHETIEKSIGDEYKVGEEYIRDKISIYKLFILISKACDNHKFNNFGEVDDRIEYSGKLHPVYKNRSGNVNRPYQNNLYKISLENREPLYVAMEHATPLVSMYEMQTDKNRCHTKFTKDDFDEQVVEFYIKLKEILERDTKCVGKYQILLCDDVINSLPEIIYKSIDDPNVDIC